MWDWDEALFCAGSATSTSGRRILTRRGFRSTSRSAASCGRSSPTTFAPFARFNSSPRSSLFLCSGSRAAIRVRSRDLRFVALRLPAVAYPWIVATWPRLRARRFREVGTAVAISVLIVAIGYGAAAFISSPASGCEPSARGGDCEHLSHSRLMPVASTLGLLVLAGSFVHWTLPALREVHSTIAPPVEAMHWIRASVPRGTPIYIGGAMAPFVDYHLTGYPWTVVVDEGIRTSRLNCSRGTSPTAQPTTFPQSSSAGHRRDSGRSLPVANFEVFVHPAGTL